MLRAKPGGGNGKGADCVMKMMEKELAAKSCKIGRRFGIGVRGK